MATYVPAVHYLVDLHDVLRLPVPPYTSAKINDAIAATSGITTINGNFVVRVPGDVSVRNPVDLNDLLQQKYAGLLAAYAGFTEVIWDDLLDSTHTNTTAPNVEGRFGERGVIAINPGKIFQSTLISPIPGAAPSQAVVTWETFEYIDTDPADGRFVRAYGGTWADLVSTCSVSFNGGVSFYGVTDGGVVNIPLLSQGTDFIIRITNTTSHVIHLGSWAVVY
jgi:hypothetical protein